MSWFGYLLVVWFVFSAMLHVSQIDQARPRITREVATVAILIDALMVWGVVAVGT